jgi:putative restriction endonuclease
MVGKAWSFISKEPAERQYGGNVGYEDQHRVLYRYDSTVANHRKVSSGDLVLIRGAGGAHGIALVETLKASQGTKTIQRCPICRSTGLKARKVTAPRWRCNNKHEFDSPLVEQMAVTLYEAGFGASYLDLDPPLSPEELKAAAPRPNDQMSMEEIQIERLEGRLLEICPKARSLVDRFAGKLTVTPIEGAPEVVPDFVGSVVDGRKAVLRQVLVRRGQAKFRDALVARYGPCCMVTGCGLLDIVEAAHIKPYRGPEDNDPANGLLLRADIHTLFDLLLLAVNPASLEISLHPRLAGLGYDHLNSTTLSVGAGKRPSPGALMEHWKLFVEQG